MGLDMYLRAKRYVSGYEFRSPEERNEYERLVEMFGVGEFVDPETPSGYVEFVIGYWRKANQVHNWFVENVQGGVDECQEAYVTREQLSELREACLRVLAASELVPGTVDTGTIYSSEHPQGTVQLAQGQIIKDPTVANDLLPSVEGFFFGHTDYDESYWYDLKETVRQLDKALAMPEEWDFEYQSSW